MRALVDARSVRARVGGCLELEFRDLEGLDGLDTRFNTPWRLPAAGAGGYNPVRYARKAATVPKLAQRMRPRRRPRRRPRPRPSPLSPSFAKTHKNDDSSSL